MSVNFDRRDLRAALREQVSEAAQARADLQYFLIAIKFSRVDHFHQTSRFHQEVLPQGFLGLDAVAFQQRLDVQKFRAHGNIAAT